MGHSEVSCVFPPARMRLIVLAYSSLSTSTSLLPALGPRSLEATWVALRGYHGVLSAPDPRLGVQAPPGVCTPPLLPTQRSCESLRLKQPGQAHEFFGYL